MENMGMYIFRNYTVEPLFKNFPGVRYSGYEDISDIPHDVSIYIWFYLCPINLGENEYIEKIRDFRQLEVWKKSHQLTLNIYKLTKNYPSEEKFGLTSQMRRSAFSVPANIAEGFTRQSKKEKKQFLVISQGSANELLYFLILSRALGYLDNIDEELQQLKSISMMLSVMIKKLSQESMASQ